MVCPLYRSCKYLTQLAIVYIYNNQMRSRVEYLKHLSPHVPVLVEFKTVYAGLKVVYYPPTI